MVKIRHQIHGTEMEVSERVWDLMQQQRKNLYEVAEDPKQLPIEVISFIKEQPQKEVIEFISETPEVKEQPIEVIEPVKVVKQPVKQVVKQKGRPKK